MYSVHSDCALIMHIVDTHTLSLTRTHVLLHTHTSKHTGDPSVAPPPPDEAAAFSLSQSLPQLLASGNSLLASKPGSMLDVSGNGLVGLMDAGEVGWRGQGVLPEWVRLVEGGGEADGLRVVVVGEAE